MYGLRVAQQQDRHQEQGQADEEARRQIALLESASIGLYLFEGILGLPVFSNSPEKGVGLVYFTGPTMGYLIGFLTAGYLASKINNKDNFLMILVKLTVATSTIYLFGLLWLGTLIGWDKPIIALGAKPFLLAEVFKVVILALVTKKILKIRSFI